MKRLFDSSIWFPLAASAGVYAAFTVWLTSNVPILALGIHANGVALTSLKVIVK